MLKAIKHKLTFRYTYWWFLLANYKRKICKDKLTLDQRSGVEDYERGVALYNQTDSALVKSRFQVYKDLNRLMQYWHCYPDVYFRMGMFLKDYTDWEQMTSFLPQIASYRFEHQWEQYLEYSMLLENKIVFNDYLSFNGIPVPKVLFSYRNGRFFAKGGAEITDDTVDSILSELKINRVFSKKATGSRGEGIAVFTKRRNNYYSSNGELVDASFIRKDCGSEDHLFEEQLSQDRVLSQFCSDTINTIRVVTMNSSGNDSRIVGASIRFGRMGGYVDNLAQGGVSVSLDIETGELFDYGMREYDLTKYYEHPDTKVQFAHVIIPQWPAIKELIDHVGALLPPFREIGWDIALTPDGPVIVELNTGTGVYSVQMGPKYGIAKAFKNCIPHFTD
jgi:hypothetical protein